jgi:aspartate-semialdehyde dehydrogenase
MKRVGIVGWRGMVGSVLMNRMQDEKDLEKVEAYLFSTSLNGQANTYYPTCHDQVLDSNSLDALREMDILLSCQGSEYSKKVHPQLRSSGWKGYWIDASSVFRMNKEATIILDPINKDQIEKALNSGKKDFIGGNCTVSLMLMALGGLFEQDLIEWLSTHTYQAASGAGARNMIELLEQSHFLTSKYAKEKSAAKAALEYEKDISTLIKSEDLPRKYFGHPLAMSLLPWIDRKMPNGQSREEWKAQAEANKILGKSDTVPIDGTCVRVSSLRCHAQAFTIKLRKDIDISTIEKLLNDHNEWVELIPNEADATLEHLTPKHVTGSLNIPIGRVRKMNLGNQFINAFTVGDQLLWGAAEPLRRMLQYLQ